MTVTIVSPEQRLREPRGARILVVGPFGIGKTSLLRTLDKATTLFVDTENGALAVDDVPVPYVRPQTWPEIRDLIVRIAGPNRSFQPNEPYSKSHFDSCGGFLPGIEGGLYRTIFFDTVTAATRLCFRWASAQPEAFSERSGKPDTRGAYGLHARDFLLALHHLQGARGLNIVLIGALETVTDDYGRFEHRLQAEGQRVPREIAGIVDIVLTMHWLDFNDGKPAQRGFVCTSENVWRYPGKDRSGKLAMIEPPDLGALIRKVVPPRGRAMTPLRRRRLCRSNAQLRQQQPQALRRLVRQRSHRPRSRVHIGRSDTNMRQRFFCVFEPLPQQTDPIRALRAVLKNALRAHGLRCVDAEEINMVKPRRIGIPTPEAIDDVWQKRATAAAIAAVRRVIDSDAIPKVTSVGRLTDIEIGWLVAAGLFAWIGTRAEQATAEGWNTEQTLRMTALDPEPWDAGSVVHILPQLGELDDVDWERPVGSWSKDTITRFLLAAMKLIATAMIARDVSGGGIATKRQSLEQMQRIASAEAGGSLAAPSELNDDLSDIPF